VPARPTRCCRQQRCDSVISEGRYCPPPPPPSLFPPRPDGVGGTGVGGLYVRGGRVKSFTGFGPFVTAFKQVEIVHAAKRAFDGAVLVLLSHFAQLVEAIFEFAAIQNNVVPAPNTRTQTGTDTRTNTYTCTPVICHPTTFRTLQRWWHAGALISKSEDARLPARNANL